jgi:hypothetical protein
MLPISPHAADSGVAALLQALAMALQASGRSRAAVERSLRWPAGSLNQLVNGAVELRAADLFEILGAIGMEPADFFRLAFPRKAPGSAAQETARERIERWQRSRPPAEAPVEGEDAAERARWKSALLELFAELGARPGQAGGPGSE